MNDLPAPVLPLSSSSNFTKQTSYYYCHYYHFLYCFFLSLHTRLSISAAIAFIEYKMLTYAWECNLLADPSTHVGLKTTWGKLMTVVCFSIFTRVVQKNVLSNAGECHWPCHWENLHCHIICKCGLLGPGQDLHIENVQYFIWSNCIALTFFVSPVGKMPPHLF